MYPRKITFTILPAKHNLRNVILETKNSTKYLSKYSFTFRQFPLGNALQNVANVKRELLKFIEKNDIICILRKNLLAIPENLKNQSTIIIRTWAHQCECVVAQRFRRGQQMFCLYTRLWEERALKEFLMKLRQQVTKRSKELMLGAVGVSAYNWDHNRIPDAEIKEHVNELEYLKKLKCNTIICNVCKKSNTQNPHALSAICCCANRKYIYVPYDNWTVFIEKKDMIIWRRPHPSGSYEYKVYGSFNDVCADDFLNVQIDINYRRQWDNTAVVLDLIEKDPNPENNGDIIYWEMLWPKLFANRDYVFKRRYMIDINTKTILLVSKHTEHPNCPATHDKHRVVDYWSNMVIRPYSDYHSPGLEFGLTYFDNPGVNIPAAVTAWVAYRAMPEFLNRLRKAAIAYDAYCERHQCMRHYNVNDFVANERQKEQEFILQKSQSSANDIKDDSKATDVILEKCSSHTPGIETLTSPIIQADVSKHTYWKYLQPTYYFS